MSSPTARARTSLCDSRRSTVCAEMRPLSYLGATSYCALTDRDAQWANRLACSVPSSASSASHRSLSDLGRRAFQRIWRSVIEPAGALRSEEHTSELQSLMRISYAVFSLKTQQKQ